MTGTSASGAARACGWHASLLGSEARRFFGSRNPGWRLLGVGGCRAVPFPSARRRRLAMTILARVAHPSQQAHSFHTDLA